MFSMFFGGVSASSFTNNRIGLVNFINSQRKEGDGTQFVTIDMFPDRESVIEYKKAYNKEVLAQKEIETKSNESSKKVLKKSVRRKISKQSRKQNRK